MVNDEEKGWAVLGVALPLIGYIVLLLAKKGGTYAHHYAKQGIVLMVLWIVLWVAGMILSFIPVVGWMLHRLLWAAWLILWIFGIVYALSEKKQFIPVVGVFAKNF